MYGIGAEELRLEGRSKEDSSDVGVCDAGQVQAKCCDVKDVR